MTLISLIIGDLDDQESLGEVLDSPATTIKDNEYERKRV